MRPPWAAAFRLAALFAFAIVLQWSAGAYQSEAGGDPDEPAHMVSGLMAREYLSSGWHRNPLEFARNYYLHYPKVAIGHWPPGFYAEQAAWMLLFPVSRASVLIMIALQSALLGVLLWPTLRDRFGSAAAWCGSLVLATLPGLAAQGGVVMTEVPLALLILLAMISWGKYLDTGRAWHAAAFALWSAAAILTKGTAMVLALVPLVSVGLSGRAYLMRRAWFWSPALIVCGIGAPWYLMAPGAVQEKIAVYGGLGLARHFDFPLARWASQFGWMVALLALAGLAILLYRRVAGTALTGTWASATALVIAATVFPVFVRSWERRHLVEAAPAFLLLAAAGTGWIASWPLLQRLAAPHRLAILALGSLVIIGWNVTRLPRQQPLGYSELADATLTDSFGQARTIVISGGAVAEGAFISEIARRERHPKRYIVRATKLFAEIGWLGQVAEERVKSTAQVNALLLSVPVDLVVVDRVTASPFAFQPLLEQALAQHPENWQPMHQPNPRFGVFRRTGAIELPTSELETRLRVALRDPIP